MANFDGFLLKRLTLSNSARAGRFGPSGDWIPEIPLKLVRSDEITGNSPGCKKNFEKFCKAEECTDAMHFSMEARASSPVPFISCS
ncbi:MAG: hypothetical protein DMG88_18820 [Acidobacteria bacterium]|nr:MAG: hypothetical protein DMG88_18820 [Acidobacteriota bacterium]